MDRIDAMKVFVATLDEGSLAGASRRLGRSPAAVSRAIAFLEEHTGTALLYRTTRTIRLSEAGERYAAACRRILADLEEADMLIADERSAPRGLLTVTAPVAAGEDVLRALIDEFIDRHPVLMGMTLAGLLPSIGKLVRQSADERATGQMLGYLQSAQFGGQVLGPVIGGQIGVALGLHSVFFVTAGLLAACAALALRVRTR